ncbi:MAG: hypothetical protein EOL97_15540 [Spirochaetia bacterium]|nr:hypothetical protein [Spirochaetia bacterium]
MKKNKKMVSIYMDSELHDLASLTTSNFSEFVEQLIIESGIDPNAVSKLELQKSELNNKLDNLDSKIIKVKSNLAKQNKRISIANELIEIYNSKKSDPNVTIDKIINLYFRKYTEHTILDKNIISKLVKEKVE